MEGNNTAVLNFMITIHTKGIWCKINSCSIFVNHLQIIPECFRKFKICLWLQNAWHISLFHKIVQKDDLENEMSGFYWNTPWYQVLISLLMSCFLCYNIDHCPWNQLVKAATFVQLCLILSLRSGLSYFPPFKI